MSKLISKYGLEPIQKILKEKLNAEISLLPDLEIERICCQGAIVGWDFVLAEALSTDTKPRIREEFADWQNWQPKHSPGAFDYGPMGPIGHMVEFINIAFRGAWVWHKSISSSGNHRVINHWASRLFYDFVNRSAFGKHPANYNMAGGPKSCGKTGTAVMFGLTMFLIFRRQMSVKVCSSTSKGSESRVFGQLIEFFRKTIYHTEPKSVVGGEFKILQGQEKRLIFCAKGADEKTVKNTLTGMELVAIKRGADGQSAVDSLIGIKAPLKLLIVDEANAVDPSIFHEELHSNWMEAVHFAQIIFLMNPSHKHRKSVEFYRPEGGWTIEDYHQDSPGWATARRGWMTNLNGLDTPNRNWRHMKDPKRDPKSPPAPFPFLMSRTSIERDEESYGGTDSAAFARMTIGFLCDEDKTDTILSARLVDSLGAAGPVEWTGEGTYPILGIDPAFGGDKFMICQGHIGYGYTADRKRRVFLELDRFRTVPFITKDKGTPEQGQVRYVMELAASLGVGPESIAADTTGSSTGFVYPFEKEMNGRIHRTYFSASPSERIAEPGDIRTSKERYTSASSELAYSIRTFLPYIKKLSDDEVLDQGCERTFEIRSGDKIQVELKQDFKQRIGSSPDKFDSLAILVDLARTMGLGTDLLVHPKLAAKRLSAAHRIVTKASYAVSQEMVGHAMYGVS
jgi:hypothetical protein